MTKGRSAKLRPPRKIAMIGFHNLYNNIYSINFDRSMTQGGVTEEESRKAAAASMKLSTDTFTAEKAAMAVEQKKQTRLAQGTIINSEKRTAAASQSKLTFKQLALPSSGSNGKDR